MIYGTKTPWRSNSVFGAVEATPSAPPSNTLTSPNAQIDLADDTIAPGVTALKVVVTEHVLPTVVSAVPVQGRVTGKLVSIPVAGSFVEGPFSRSVTCTDWSTCSWPV